MSDEPEKGSSLGGVWPGGPSRERPARERARIETMEERADRIAGLRRERRLRGRRRRFWLVLVAVAVLSAVGGYVMGRESHRSAEDLAREEERRASPAPEDVIRTESNRILQQMWLTEILERQTPPP